MSKDHKLLIVSNRLPIVINKEEDGNWNIKAGSGGLVTALKPVLKQYGGSWIGWPGDAGDAPVDELLGKIGDELGCEFHGVDLSPELVDLFYYGFSNETVWPLFHDLFESCTFEQGKWEAYKESNRLFAETLKEKIEEDQTVWVHDYQLIMVGQMIREMGTKSQLTFFLHIPFPPPDIFRRLPWRKELLRAFLSYDLIGFQTQRDMRNFSNCIRQFVPDVTITTQKNITHLMMENRYIRVCSVPISIDFDDFKSRAESQPVQDTAWYIHEHIGEVQVIVGVDRLDFTKGLPERFYAFARALEKYPELHGKIALAQIVVPSRMEVPQYQLLKEKLDGIVGEINGRFGFRGWVPIHYMFRSVPQTELLGYYRASEICLVTSIKDGMNLVCKEYCACSVDDNGVLILSEFAGAASQLENGAMIVNPHDEEHIADCIYNAWKMPVEERKVHMKKLRREIKRNDVYRWVKQFLDQSRKLIETK